LPFWAILFRPSCLHAPIDPYLILPIWAIMFRPSGLLAPKDLYIILPIWALDPHAYSLL
jgi:hypothetical protein